MENNNYVSVGNIIEQERLKRQAQIAKGVSSDVYNHIEKAHQDDLSKGVEMTDNLSRFADDVDNLNKAETEFLLSKLQRQIVVDPQSSLLKSFKSIAINHLNDLEKAHKDGDHHPTKPWVWVSSANGGKGDWRVEGGRAHKKAGASVPAPQTFEAFYNQFKRDYKWNHPTATDMQVYDEAMKAYKKSKTTDAVASQTPTPRKPGSTDEIERMTAQGVRSSILGLNNIATNVKDNGDHFKIDFDVNDFNTNGKRSPQIDRIAKFLESMGASCVIGKNEIKAYKKVEAKKNTTSKTQSPQDKVKDVMQQFDDTTMDEDEFDEYVDSVLGNDMGQKLRKQILESNKSFSDKKQAYKDAVERHLGLKPQKYSDMDIKDAKKALVGKVVTLKDYWPDGRGGSQDAIGEIKNVRLYGKNKTPIAEVTYPNGDEQMIRLDEIDDGKMKDFYKTPVTIGDDKKAGKSKAAANKIDDTTIDQAEYDSQLKIAKQVDDSSRSMAKNIIQGNIDKTKKKLQETISSRPGAKATITALQKDLTKFISQKKAVEDANDKGKTTIHISPGQEDAMYEEAARGHQKRLAAAPEKLKNRNYNIQNKLEKIGESLNKRHKGDNPKSAFEPFDYIETGSTFGAAVPKDNEFEFRICTNFYVAKNANEFVNSMMPEIEKLANKNGFNYIRVREYDAGTGTKKKVQVEFKKELSDFEKKNCRFKKLSVKF